MGPTPRFGNIRSTQYTGFDVNVTKNQTHHGLNASVHMRREPQVVVRMGQMAIRITHLIVKWQG